MGSVLPGIDLVVSGLGGLSGLGSWLLVLSGSGDLVLSWLGSVILVSGLLVLGSWLLSGSGILG